MNCAPATGGAPGTGGTQRPSSNASQPWPFPGSLMIGCIGEALTDVLTIDHDELEDARWFSRSEVRAMLDGTHPDGLTCPPPIAIAHAIMRAWAIDGEGA